MSTITAEKKTPIRSPKAPPEEKEKRGVDARQLTRQIPRYHVILLDDNTHTYEYVVEMLMKLFRHNRASAFAMACQVDRAGRAIVFTTNREQAELKRAQIHDYGADWRLPHSRGSMSALIEPAA